jgi:hypothetical protein
LRFLSSRSGDHAPSYIHKLIKDMYDDEDLVF